jgi:hypothetical protein
MRIGLDGLEESGGSSSLGSLSGRTGGSLRGSCADALGLKMLRCRKMLCKRFKRRPGTNVGLSRWTAGKQNSWWHGGQLVLSHWLQWKNKNGKKCSPHLPHSVSFSPSPASIIIALPAGGMSDKPPGFRRFLVARFLYLVF